MPNIGYGAGKVILFGEHVVVHHEPALVMSLPLYTEVQLIPYDPNALIIDNRPKHPNYVPFKSRLYTEMVKAIMMALNLPYEYSFILGGNLPVASGGIGASAAAAVAITRALQFAYKISLSVREVMEIALIGERMVHGNPSGVDTTAAALEGILFFQKEEFVLIHRQLAKQPPPLPFFLVDSQQLANTKQSIEYVANFKRENPIVWQRLVMRYREIFSQAMPAVMQGNFVLLGSLFNKKQRLLADLGLSCCHVEKVISTANQLGCLGAKMTGSCQGGLVLVLGKDFAHISMMKKAFAALGYFVVDCSGHNSKMVLSGVNPSAYQSL